MKDPKAVARAMAAKKAKALKRSTIPWKIGDAIRTKPSVGPPKYRNVPGEVIGINGADRELHVKTSSGVAWFRPEELDHDDDPVFGDDNDTEFFDDGEFEEEFEEE